MPAPNVEPFGTMDERVRMIFTRCCFGSGNFLNSGRFIVNAHGHYTHPVQWTMTAHDVVLAGADQYLERIRAWAHAIDDALVASGNQ